ncbi:regulator of chromosome condensation 1/beta-lactamase-inhibitor protein II [Limtongia smithiae]|uniref:regulator of chromosome condensation 1/beta-lactamase-inhibitor protein II n=1 Tax=Limtongia smithiae TaxID=1125753 RepID=UPI0034CE5BCD
MAPVGRKRKAVHDDAAEDNKAAAAPKRAATRGRRVGSSQASTAATTKASLATATDSVVTTITEPDTDFSPTENGVHEKETTIEAKTNGKQVKTAEAEPNPAVTKANGFDSKRDEHAVPYKLRKTTGRVIVPIPRLKTEPLNVYVFGTGSMSELGLGPDAKNKEVKRPRLNPYLDSSKVSIVDFAVGGAHVIAIDKDGKLWSWGCNDHGALGRNTTSGDAATLRDIDADDDDDDGDLNPSESTPAKVEDLPSDLVFVQVAASDNLSLALTSEGRIWAWGTFRCNEGVLGFNEHVEFQRQPVQVIVPYAVGQIVAGKDHVMALTTTGRVYSWGNGQQFQLGRRVMDRAKMQSLVPREFGIKNIKFIGSGEFHAFAIDSSGRVMAWGLNQFGQCGIPSEGAGEDGAVVTSPTYIDALATKDIIYITGGEHHSVALSSTGELYVFGRIDSSEIGIEKDLVPDAVVKDEGGHPRFLPIPTKLVVEDDGDNEVSFKFIGCGSHHNIALAKDGSAWSWGFGETYQVGQGPAGEDVEVPTKIENTATRGIDMMITGAGGQFSVLGGTASKDRGAHEG